ncbi:MAG: binding-protein-dependent transport system inner rane component [Paenibacillaceae bacterium]|jgi:multiple sugar transport system permease protein|nr:binding-protein-dependent transport system inner rane component [Paenibacillaceae bacterium]
MRKRTLAPYLFLLPAMLGLLAFKLYPMVSAAVTSLFALRFGEEGRIFVGMDNYLVLLREPMFWKSLRNTVVFNLLLDPLTVILAFALALLLNSRLRGIIVFRSVHFVPVAVSVPTACVLWGIMLNPEKGVVNSLLVSLGLEAQPFLSASSQSLLSMIAIVAWKSIGYWAIFLLAGLQEVSAQLYEAAAIDGATAWEKFTNVTWPMMKRPVTFVAVAVTSHNFFLFSPMYILTQGGPEHSTNTLMLESFNSAFLYSDPGRASSIVVVLIGITLIMIALQFKFLRAGH